MKTFRIFIACMLSLAVLLWSCDSKDEPENESQTETGQGTDGNGDENQNDESGNGDGVVDDDVVGGDEDCYLIVGQTSWNAPAVGALTMVITVEASGEWDMEYSAEWLSVEKNETGLSLTAEENTACEERYATIVLTCVNGDSSALENISVTQDGKAYITVGLDGDALELSSSAGVVTVVVESNFDWECSSTGVDWLTAAKAGTTSLQLTYSANDSGDSRSAVISLSASDGAENSVSAEFSVTQPVVGSESLIFEYTITSAGTQIKLPLYTSVNASVNWGDGSSENVTTAQPPHTYSSAGVYEVTVDGAVAGLYSNGLSSAVYLTAVKQWGKTGLTTMYCAFKGCSALVSLPETTGAAFADVTDFQSVLFGCSVLESIPSDFFADCSSSVSALTNSFEDCTSITELPDGLLDALTNLDTVTHAFYGCTSLRTIPASLFAKNTGITNFEYVFYNCGLTEIPDGLFSNNAKGEKFSSAFAYNASLKSVPAGLLDNTSVSGIGQFFLNCSGLESLPEALFGNIQNCTSFERLFKGCISLQEIPTDLFKNCGSVTSFSDTFNGCTGLTSISADLFQYNKSATKFDSVFEDCSGLTEIPAGLFSGFSSVTTFSSAFKNCIGLTSLPEAGIFSDVPSAKTITYLFSGCTGLESVPEGFFDNLPAATTFADAFNGCTSLKTIPVTLYDNCKSVTSFARCFNGCVDLEGESPYTVVEGVNVHLYERSTALGFSNISSSGKTNCFTGCTKLDDYEAIFEAGWAKE